MENILKQLKEIELRKQIKILYACETGSRAWGFPSPDSDFDVRFIYMQHKDWYLSLSDRKDTIETAITNDLDITGWDLRKALHLLKKANAPLIERFQSPIVYYNEAGFKDNFNSLINAYYSPTGVFYHHYSLARKFWEEIKDKDAIKLKAYFYLVRSLLSCNWIVKNDSVVPMDIQSLMQLISQEDRALLQSLIALKATVDEKYLHTKSAAMQELVVRLFNTVEASKDTLGVNSNSYALIDEFFIKTLYESTNN